MKRILCQLEGTGPALFVITACMHGNEQAGIEAIRKIETFIREEYTLDGKLNIQGTIVGMIGNKQAVQQNVRYIDSDLNRMWEKEFVYKVMEENPETQKSEVREMHEIILTLRKIVMTGKYSKLYLLDLHTTSSDGIFAICTEDHESIHMANQLHVPVVRGLLKGISGTTLHYFNQNNLGINATALAFEGGRHDDPLSSDRMMAASIFCLQSMGVIQIPEHHEHEEILIEYSKNLPKCVEVMYKYHIEDKQSWEMLPGFSNFDPVKQGQLLATDQGKDILCPFDGLILMPLYQKKGRDGFFIVKEIQTT